MKKNCSVCSIAQFCKIREVVNEGFCMNFTRQQPFTCSICHNIVLPKDVTWDNEKPICPNCINRSL